MTKLPDGVHPDIRINSYGWYLRKRFGCRVSKVNVDAGFTCPNRDGSRGHGGCIYCDNSSFSPGATQATIPIADQMAAGMAYHRQRLGSEKFIIYFQKYTNTYGPADRLAELYTSVLSRDDVVGISIGTRPDAVTGEVAQLLEEIARKKYVCLELGLQSMDDTILERINRGHTLEEYIAAVRLLSGRGLDICTHLIYGFPGESRAGFLRTAELLADLGINSVKLHQLHAVKGTRLAELYRQGEFIPLERDEYVAAACDFLERLPTDITIQRLYGSAPLEIRVAPTWGLKNNQMWYAVLNELKARNSWQGKLLHQERS
jgi:radical SAM protein (TIGR01212 family)